MKAIIVGRHKLSGDEGLEVIRQENINFPATSRECKPILESLIQQAFNEGVALIFQAIPGQVNTCLPRLILDGVGPEIGIIINKPGPRPTGVEKKFDFVGNDMTQLGDEAIQLMNFVNPRAKGANNNGVVSVVVDPPLRFEFSHIEWF